MANENIRALLLKSKQCPAAHWTPGKSRQMFIGRQQQYWRLKMPDQFPEQGTRYLHSEDEAAHQLKLIVEPMGLTLNDFERLGQSGPVDIEDTADEAGEWVDPHANLLLLAETAIRQHEESLDDILESFQGRSSVRDLPYLFVVRNKTRFEIQVPEELQSYMKPVRQSFATAQQAHLHVRDSLSDQDYNPDLLFT